MKVNEIVYQQLFKTSQEAIILVDAKTGVILDVNSSVYLFFGYQNYELTEKVVWEVRLFQNILESKDSFFDISKLNLPFNLELPIPTKNRKIILAEVIVNKLSVNQENILTFTFRDIYKQKKTENDLNKSEESWHSLTMNSPNHILILDLHGKVRFINWVTSGFKKEDIVNNSIYNIIPSQFVERVKESLKDVRKTKKAKIYETKFVFPDGKVVWYDARIAPIIEYDEIMGYTVNCSDITKRKNTEIELNKSNKKLHELTLHMQEVIENEKKKIALDLHDDLGQKLTALHMDLSWLKTRIIKDLPHLSDKLNDMAELLNLSMKNVQEIATELRPSILDNLGLISAVEWLLEEYMRKSNIEYQFDVSPEGIKINKQLTVAIFRIIQEALTNVVRHANATIVKVSIEKESNLLNVMIKDNGKGITKSNIEGSKSFGLMGIKERASVFKGKVEITGELNKGTKLLVKIPYD